MNRILPFIVLLIPLIAQLGNLSAAPITIDIPTSGGTAGNWGPDNGLSFGQLFTAPVGATILDTYSLTVQSSFGLFPFVSQIYAWSGTGVTGPALFTSSPPDTTTTLMTTFDFLPGIAVTAGQQYVAFVTNQPFGVPLGGVGAGNISINPFDVYPGGNLVIAIGNPEDLGTGTWISPFNVDAQFHAEFSGPQAAPVPEPATIALWSITGIIGAVYGKRRRS